MIKLTEIIDQQEKELYYDFGRDFQSFQRTVDVSTEEAKNRFEKGIGSKILNKRIEVRASKGFKQPVKTFTLDKVTSISIDDYFDNWVVVVKDQKNKEYFLQPGYKIKVLGPGSDGEEPKQNPTTDPKTNNNPEPVVSKQQPDQKPQDNTVNPQTIPPKQTSPVALPKKPLGK